jgi:HlyD family secretion protein
MIDRRTGPIIPTSSLIIAVNSNPLMKPSGVKLVLAGSMLALALLGYGSYTYFAQGSKPSAEAIAEQKKAEDKAKEENAGIGALGRLEPEGEVFKIAPPAVGLSSRVLQIGVKEGDEVKEGQRIAIMDSALSLQVAVDQAQAQVLEAQARLEQIQAGSKDGDINAQKGAVIKATSALSQAKAEAAQSASLLESASAELEKRNWDLDKARELCEMEWKVISESGEINQRAISESGEINQNVKKCKNGAISETDVRSRILAVATQEKQVAQAINVLDQRRKIVEQAAIEIEVAQERLNSVREVRPTDIKQAEAQLQTALANRQKALVDLENAAVKAPISGQVLKVYTKSNEAVGNNGIMEIGRTSQMYAIAEVDENLINRVKPGQKAIVKSDAFVGEITGQVVSIGSKVGKNSITSTDPADKQDSRVVEVKVRLDSSELVRGLTNLQVKVAIKP